jgi:hypothetical protein
MAGGDQNWLGYRARERGRGLLDWIVLSLQFRR